MLETADDEAVANIEITSRNLLQTPISIHLDRHRGIVDGQPAKIWDVGYPIAGRLPPKVRADPGISDEPMPVGELYQCQLVRSLGHNLARGGSQPAIRRANRELGREQGKIESHARGERNPQPALRTLIHSPLDWLIRWRPFLSV